jgi:mycothiol synthase
VIRPPTPADFDAVLEVLQACDRDVYGGTDWTADELRQQWAEIDLATDAWLVEDETGAVVGVMHLCERRSTTFIGDGYVAPAARGRGVGTRLVRQVEARVRERLDEAPSGSRVTLHLAHLVGDETAPALLRQEGFERERSFFRMVADLSSPPPVPAWPAGVELRPLDPERDGRALHQADSAAFAGHWGFRAQPYEEWFDRIFVGPRLDLALPVVAWADGAIAGFALNYPKRMGDWGWVGVLGVSSSWRRRGLGLALLQESFHRFLASGESTVALGVDAENPTGATRLYERAGMRVLWQADVWEKELRVGS